LQRRRAHLIDSENFEYLRIVASIRNAKLTQTDIVACISHSLWQIQPHRTVYTLAMIDSHTLHMKNYRLL
jgi:hypothetical protein